MRGNGLGKYVLIGQTAVLEPDLMVWATWLETADRIVFQTEFPGGLVSTIFLALDHQWDKDGPPLLFETMVFRGAEGELCRRCSDWLEAEAQHRAVVEEVAPGLFSWARGTGNAIERD